MKKVFLVLMLICANVMVWGQTDRGKEILKKANAGDASAQSELAECYEFGEEGFAKDGKQALAWYTKAAEKNDAYALRKLTMAYKEGRMGANADEQKYICYLEKAAQAGDSEFMTDLAVCYRDGKYGFEKDENQFLSWIKKAIDAKYSKALYELGYYYKTKNNKNEAVKWFKECADYYYYISGLKHEDSLRELKQLGMNYDPTAVDSMTFRKTYKYPSTAAVANPGSNDVTENNQQATTTKSEKSDKSNKSNKSNILNNIKDAEKVVKSIKGLLKK